PQVKRWRSRHWRLLPTMKGKVNNMRPHTPRISAAARRRELSRRTFLHGVGVTMALPWLESIRVWGAEPPASAATGAVGEAAAGAAAAGPFPKRFAVMFMGNGINGNHWWAKGQGAEMKLGKTLQPLEPVKSKVNVINGLYNPVAVGKGIHPAQT